MAEEQVTATQADGAPAPHASDTVPVETVSAPALIVAKEESSAPEAPAAAGPEGDEAPADGKKPPKLPEWAQKEMAKTAFEARENKRRAEAAEKELEALKAPKPEPSIPNAADAAAANAAAPAGGYRTAAEFDKAVTEEASRRETAARVAAQRDQFNAKSNEAFESGKTAFGNEFGNAVANLHQVGLLPYVNQADGQVYNNEILEMVLATDDPAKVLYELGSDPDKAASIVGMSPAARAIEIAKLSVAAPQRATPAAVSNAPRPITPIDGSARVSSAPSDNDDDETFFRKREAELAAKRAAG